MKKILLLILMIPVLSNCGQYSAMIGPSYTLVETGSILQASTSLSSSLAMNNSLPLLEKKASESKEGKIVPFEVENSLSQNLIPTNNRRERSFWDKACGCFKKIFS